MTQQSNGLQGFIRVVSHPVFAVFWLGLAALSFITVDKPVAYFWHQQSHGWMVAVAQVITRFGYGWYYLLISACLFLVAQFMLKARSLAHKILFVFLAVAVPGFICDGLKILWGRSRPVELFHQHLYGFYFFQFKADMWSFPSGHATVISGIMMAFSLLWPRYWLGFMAMALCVVASRVLVTAHFISDVMVGWYLGTVVVIIMHRYLIQKQWLDIASQQTALSYDTK